MIDTTAARPGDHWRAQLARVASTQAHHDRDTSPPFLDPEMFRWRPEELAERLLRPSLRPAIEALPPGGSVLDVGVGGGSSSLVLAPYAGLIVGVDHDQAMLASFMASARAVGVAAEAVLGTWPQAAALVEPADIVVCHHAMYNVAEIEDFIGALTARGRRRVVVELLARPPTAWLNPLWKAFHEVDRPDWPVADDAEAVIRAMGFAVERRDAVMPPRAVRVTPEAVAFARRRLSVGPERDGEIEAFLRERKPEREHLVALWWPGAA
jgi:SAM-dependent methyltransferase